MEPRDRPQAVAGTRQSRQEETQAPDRQTYSQEGAQGEEALTMPKAAVVRRGPFKTVLRRIRGKGGWTYVTIPKRLAPPITRAWARTPVRASIDGPEWDPSI